MNKFFDGEMLGYTAIVMVGMVVGGFAAKLLVEYIYPAKPAKQPRHLSHTGANNMFSWFKAKPPEPQWEVTCDGYGVYRVQTKREYSWRMPQQLNPGYYFLRKEYRTLQDAENAIQEYVIREHNQQRKVVKTL